MKQYTNYRKIQGEDIQVKTNSLTNYYQKLNIQKTAKQKLIEENQKERLSLESEKQVQQELVNSITKDKNKIIAEIKKKQSESRTIDKKIDRLIREAIAEANRKAAKEKADKIRIAKENAAKEKLALEKAAKEKAIEIAKSKSIENAKLTTAEKSKTKTVENPKTAPIVKSVPKETASSSVSTAAVSSTVIDLTPSGKIVSDNFRANRGRLPWPVEKGKITLGYGDQPHPVYKTLTVHNSGLEFTTNSGASALAVFAGEVASVFVLSPVNKAVMIKHGDFFTVYQNLSSVNVGKGDKVSIKQNIGQIRTNGEGKTILKFTLSQNTTYTNPKVWLSPR